VVELLKLYCRVKGAGPPVVFTAGIGDTADAWNAIAGELESRARITVATVDRIGLQTPQVMLQTWRLPTW
jgi:hypothetical protein